jgi:hypothetical protein
MKWTFSNRRHDMNGIIYIIGLVVVVVAVASYFGFAWVPSIARRAGRMTPIHAGDHAW